MLWIERRIMGNNHFFIIFFYYFLFLLLIGFELLQKRNQTKYLPQKEIV